MKRRSRPEVLAPAGNLRGLKTAIDYGADAVYCGGKAFGMRSAPRNLSIEDFKEGAAYAHNHGARVYVTLNILPRNNEIPAIEHYIEQLRTTGIDALIVTDIGIMMMARRIAPELELHVSTQAGVTNYCAANALYELGAKRVVLARELDVQSVRDIRARIPQDLDIEAFVHGSMCMAFSGRCLISNYLTGRDGNHGECAQPCRWKYSLVEEKRPGQVFPVEETKQGTYIFNSQDMNMMEHIDDLLDSGVTSLKIEGRAKSAYYVAAMTNAYKTAVNEYMIQRGFEDENGNELEPFTHRIIALDNTAAYEDDSAAHADDIMNHADAAFSGMPGLDLETDTAQLADNPTGEADHAKTAPAPAESPAESRAKTRRETDELDQEIAHFTHAAVEEAEHITLPDWLLEEPYKVAHREYSTGFYYPEQKVTQNTDRNSYTRDWLVVGEVLDWSADEGGRVTLMSRNKIEPGQLIEILLPGEPPLEYIVPDTGLRDDEGNPVDMINNPAHVFSMPMPTKLPVNSAIRSRTKKPTLKAE